MIKKVFHLADIHIRTYKMHEECKEVFKKTLKEMRQLASPYDRSELRIVIAGDYVHNKIQISNEQLILGTWFLRKLEEIAPVVLIAGNHDLVESNKDRMDSLTPMVSLLPDLDIRYYKKSECVLDENIVWCTYSIFEDNDRPNIEESKENFGTDKKYIGLFHAPIIGCKTDIGHHFEHGEEPASFDGLDVCMLGDIHLRQTLYNKVVTESGEEKKIPLVYPSSLLQQNYGEKVNGHGFLFWDVDTLTFTEHDIETSYGFYQFKINSIDDIENNAEVLTNI